MENFKIITVENNESFVTIDTLVSFSGNAEVAVRQLLRDNESDIMDFSEKILNFNGFSGFRRINANSKTIDWDKVRLNEDQASYLLTLMKNSPEVKTFKKNLIKEFRALKNQKQKNLTPVEHMAIANKMLLDEVEEKRKLIAHNERMIASLNIIEASAHDTGDTMQVEEFCKIVTDIVEGAKLGRTNCYIILRSMSLVMSKSTRPTQQGIERKYLNYTERGGKYTTLIYTAKANDLIKIMVRHLQDNEHLAEALGYPFTPEDRV